MNERRIGRRQAIKMIGASVAVGTVTGCGGAVAHVARVVVRLPWKSISQVLKAVVNYADKILSIVVMVDTAQKELNASLSDDQANSLKSGGKLYLKTEDGKEYEIPFTSS
jgi:hypothetical protein